MTLTVLGIPTSAGAYGPGQERAPDAIRRAGLMAALSQRGVEAEDEGDAHVEVFAPDPKNRKAQNRQRVAGVARDVSERVARIIRRGDVPLVIGGDCTITLGVVAGLLKAGVDPAVAYVDGDLDLSTPENTSSGILDAMGVAHMLDLPGVDALLAGLGVRRPLLSGHDLALVGFEDAADDEIVLLEQRGVGRFPASALRADPVGTAHRVLEVLHGNDEHRPVLVHFDVDAIDSVDSPLAHFPHFNVGSPLDAVGRCLSALCEAPGLVGLVVTEVNPHHDPDGSQLSRLAQVIADALSSHGPTPARSTFDHPPQEAGR